MMKPKDLALALALALRNKKGRDILVLDVKHLTTIADYFVIAGAGNTLQVRAMAEEAEEKLGQAGVEPRRKEGYADARWVVLDYASVIVHIFHEEERAYYNIERLWMDGGNQVSLPDETETEA